MTTPPITGTVTVAPPIDKACGLFTASFDAWWPRAFHIGAAEVDEIVLEPFVDGRWYERGVDGSERDWTVAVEHRGFERLVGGQAVHDTIDGGGGWALLLSPYGGSVA